MNTRTRVLVSVAVMTAFLIVLVSVGRATQTHATTGSSGTHRDDYHQFNPGHVLIEVAADHGGGVMSGGRYHDGCKSGAAFCHPAMGGDWGLDIGDRDTTSGNPLHSASKLYVDFAGYVADSDNDAPVDYSQDIKLEMRVDVESNFRGAYFLDPSYPGCNYQKYGIYLTYTDIYGTPHERLNVGWVGIAHLDNWKKRKGPLNDPATWIQPTNWRSTGSGGMIGWFNGLWVGNVYEYADPSGCSGGPHSHIEFFSKHNHGDAIEFHSKDARSEVFDGYVDMPPVSDHVMLGTGSGPNVYSDSGDSVSGGQYLGDLGGGSTSFYMRNLYH